MRSSLSASAAAVGLAGYGVTKLMPRLSWRHAPALANASERESCPQHRPATQAAAASTGTPRPLRVLSQNVWNSFFAGGPRRRKRLQAFGEFLQLHEVDIVVVQEMFVFGLGPVMDKVDAEAAADLMHNLGFIHQTSFLHTLPKWGQSSGLVVYSKLPILREEHHVFPPHMRRSLSCKGWLETELELPMPAPNGSRKGGTAPRRLVLLDTHLEHAREASWRRVREQQWQQLAARVRELLQDTTGQGSLVAVLGDFNVCNDDFGKLVDGGAEYAALQGAMTDAGLPHDLTAEPSMPTLREPQNGKKLRCSVDHAFCTSMLNQQATGAAQVLDTRGLDGLAVSDHRAVLLELHGVE